MRRLMIGHGASLAAAAVAVAALGIEPVSGERLGRVKVPTPAPMPYDLPSRKERRAYSGRSKKQYLLKGIRP